MSESMYKMKTIKEISQIIDSPIFHIDNFQWRNVYKPKSYGRMAFIENRGIYVTLTCEEKNPKRDCKNNQVYICQDSVMEAFFAFTKNGSSPVNEDMYINYEMNANGMLYAKYGPGRNNRKFISAEQLELSACTAEIDENFWAVSFLLPKELLDMLGVWNKVEDGDTFYCNFYKISENPSIEHYASYSPIDSDVPNFHLPVNFARARRA